MLLFRIIDSCAVLPPPPYSSLFITFNFWEEVDDVYDGEKGDEEELFDVAKDTPSRDCAKKGGGTEG